MVVKHRRTLHLADGSQLYRFLGVFGFTWYIAIVPIILYIFSIIMSCIFLAEVTGAGASFFSTSTVNFALGYWAGSIATTMLLTGFIVGKLLYIRSQLRGALGAEFDRRSPYVTISAMLVESACLYSACALAFIILFARNDPFQNIFLPILGQVQIIAPLLIVLRVAQGRCFTQKSLYQTTTLAFSSRPSRAPVSVQFQMDVVRSGSDPSTAITSEIAADVHKDSFMTLGKDPSSFS